MDGQWPSLLFTQPIEQASNFTDGPYGLGGGGGIQSQEWRERTIIFFRFLPPSPPLYPYSILTSEILQIHAYN